MIRPLTLACMLLAGASGLYLYQEKHRTGMLDREIARTIRDTAATRAQTEQLRADWAVLNDPERLRALSDRFLQLQPMQPAQWVQWGQWNDLASRLPAPIPATPAPSGGTDEDEAVVAEAAPAPALQAQPAPVAIPAAAHVAAALPVAMPVVQPAVAQAAAAPRPAPAVQQVLAEVPHPRPAPSAHTARPTEPVRLARATRAHDVPEREVAQREATRAPLVPVLATMAAPTSRLAEPRPVVTRAMALPEMRPAMMTSSLGGARGPSGGGYAGGSAIGGVRGALPPPTPVAYPTPYTGDR